MGVGGEQMQRGARQMAVGVYDLRVHGRGKVCSVEARGGGGLGDEGPQSSQLWSMLVAVPQPLIGP